MRQNIILSKSIENVPLWEIDLLCQLHNARLDIKNNEIVFFEINSIPLNNEV